MKGGRKEERETKGREEGRGEKIKYIRVSFFSSYKKSRRRTPWMANGSMMLSGPNLPVTFYPTILVCLSIILWSQDGHFTTQHCVHVTKRKKGRSKGKGQKTSNYLICPLFKDFPGSPTQ